MQLRYSAAIAALFLMVSPICARAQSAPRIETRTRLVNQFSELQRQWLTAVQKKDSAALDQLLSEDFETWTPLQAGPMPREDWQAQAFAYGLVSYHISDMAVKAFGETTAVESFRLETTAAIAGPDKAEHFYVVNVWTNGKDGWRCTDSYVSPVAPSASPSHLMPVRPSGKQ